MDCMLEIHSNIVLGRMKRRRCGEVKLALTTSDKVCVILYCVRFQLSGCGRLASMQLSAKVIGIGNVKSLFRTSLHPKNKHQTILTILLPLWLKNSCKLHQEIKYPIVAPLRQWKFGRENVDLGLETFILIRDLNTHNSFISPVEQILHRNHTSTNPLSSTYSTTKNSSFL